MSYWDEDKDVIDRVRNDNEYWENIRIGEEKYRKEEEERQLAEYKRQHNEESEFQYEEWYKSSESLWKDDAGQWGIRQFPGMTLTTIVHYCSGYQWGHMISKHWNGAGTTGLRCNMCYVYPSDEVVALHMLQNPEEYTE